MLAFIKTPLHHGRERPHRSRACGRKRSIYSAFEDHKHLPKVWVCTSSTCRGNSLLSTMRVLVSNTEASIEPTGCLGECGNGPNVAITSTDATRIEKHIDSVEQTVRLLERLKFEVDEDMVVVAAEKEKGDISMLKGEPVSAGAHYEKAIRLIAKAGSSSKKLLKQYETAILCNWAQSLVKTSNHKSALSLANKAIDIHADCVAAWKWKARAHEGMRQFDKAKQCWEVWGKLSGKTDEAIENIKRCTGWRWWFS
eukprot:TRINITY_DN233_c0_g1_i1.p1 TRINITY_DN233_c0_g1~~TRINITY_DN233_c0_g1_i1.p1  ORF type:complete len:254 (-),score=26.02 TRINITY_DN233_c0_g1_i1:1643-2404(-)